MSFALVVIRATFDLASIASRSGVGGESTFYGETARGEVISKLFFCLICDVGVTSEIGKLFTHLKSPGRWLGSNRSLHWPTSCLFSAHTDIWS